MFEQKVLVRDQAKFITVMGLVQKKYSLKGFTCPMAFTKKKIYVSHVAKQKVTVPHSRGYTSSYS